MGKAIWIAPALVVVLLVAGVFWYLTRDLDRYRDEVERQLEALTGRTATVSGELGLALFPDLKVKLSDVAIGDADVPVLSLPEVHAIVSLTSLLTLDLAIERIRIVGPSLTIDRSEEAPLLVDSQATSPPAVRIDAVEIIDARVIWHSELHGVRVFEGLDLAIESKGLDGPFEITGRYTGNAGNWHVDGAIGRLSRPSLPVSLVVRSDAGATLRAAGNLTDWRNDTRFAGTVRLDVPDLARLTGLTTAESLPASFDAVIAIGGDAVEISDLALQLDDTLAFGSIEWSAGELALRMTSSMLDLDLLAALARELDSDHPALAWLLERDVVIDVAVEHAHYRNRTAQQVEVVALFVDGTLEIERAVALLPGNTAVMARGIATISGDIPIFRGPVDVTSSDLRSTLAWLGVDLDGIPPDRLRTARLSAHCEATPGSIVLSAMDLALDSSSVSGSLISQFAAGRSVIADLDIDELALDAYLPDTWQEVDWSDFTLDVRSEIATLVMGDVVAAGVVIDGALNQGTIEFRRLEARDVAGAAVRGSGMIEPLPRTVAFDVEVTAPDTAAMLRGAGVDIPFDVHGPATMEFSLAVQGTFDDVDLEATLATAVADVTVRGRLLQPRTDPSFSGALEIKGNSLAAASGFFGLEVPAPEEEPFTLSADIDIVHSELRLAVVGETLGATLDASGHLTDLILDEGRVVLKHPDWADLMDRWGMMAPDASMAGPLDIAVEVTGSSVGGVALLERGIVGRSSLEGELMWSKAANRPVIDLRLAADTIVLDALASWLPMIVSDADTRLDLVADQLVVGTMALDNVVLRSTAQGGVLHLETLTGSFYGGTIQIAGTASHGLPHEVTYAVVLEDGELGDILATLAGRDTLSGRLSLAAKGTTQGFTAKDLLQSLAGEGRMTLRRGTVEGLDLRAMAEDAQRVATAREIDRSAGGGASEIVRADASFSLSEGVLGSDDLVVIFNGAEGTYALEVDLPRRWVTLGGAVQLTAASTLPPVIMSLVGPLDATDLVLDTRLLEAHLASTPAPLPEDAPSVVPDETDGDDNRTAAEDNAPGVDEGQEDDGSLFFWTLDGDDQGPDVPEPRPAVTDEGGPDGRAVEEEGSILRLLD